MKKSNKKINPPSLDKEAAITALQTVKDPEVGFDVWSMGLIYKIDIDKNNVKILMTYTTPFCPWGSQLNDEITAALKNAGADKVNIEITFDPPYKIPDDMRAMLGI
ncbi:MAG: metal-sulfur cluster assembly factor [Candidatus Magasanikbacteria bacterium]|nr:metal-sulfur cluster assembly factor [Candidatus Magasanikbacteria bacterium]